MPTLVNGRQPRIELPSPLDRPEGGRVANAGEWFNSRRRAVIDLFERRMFGRVAPRPEGMRFELLRERPDALGGRAVRREVRIHLEHRGRIRHADALWYLPRAALERGEESGERLPLIIGLNFHGNASCSTDDDLSGEEPRSQAHRWCFGKMIDAGCSMLTAPRDDFFPDHERGLPDSVHRLRRDFTEADAAGPSPWTAISAWAFGASRLLDLALTEPAVDPGRIWIHGHSRLGKTALWAAANDPRFAGCVSNDSGTCGAALLRDPLPEAESLAAITGRFHWWFTPEPARHVDAVDALPFDMHFLASLIAPRPLLIASASGDRWADPYNEFRTALAVGEVYGLFGMAGLEGASFPEPNARVFGDGVGYSLREGKHDVTDFDWSAVLDFIAGQSGK